jgi:dethiobiotin synthetase
MSKAVFVTGTDTEVGKTLVSCGLIGALQAHYSVVNGYKPIAAGASFQQHGLVNDDALALMQASSVDLNYQQVNPVVFQAAIAPHIAAHYARQTIDIGLMSQGLAELRATSNCVLVEGAGGWHVPLTEQQTLSQWVAEQGLPVILVVGVKLGCLNHALLSVEAIAASGAKLIGWVANNLAEESEVSAQNVSYLKQAIAAPCIGEIPYLTNINEFSLKDCFNINKFIDQM